VADEEFRVEVELDDDEHGFSFWERLRALGLDDDARKRLGANVTVTRDGTRMLLYAHSLSDAKEAERTVIELVAAEDLSARYSVTRWDPASQEWIDATAQRHPDNGGSPAATSGDEVPDPNYLLLQRYKPEFIRDLGL